MKSLRERKEKPISMMTDVKINANERIDDLCRDNLKLIQNTEVFLSLIHISEPTRH